MSYILDALKKSEQERKVSDERLSDAGSIFTSQNDEVIRNNFSRKFLIYSLLIVMALIFIAYWINPSQNEFSKGAGEDYASKENSTKEENSTKAEVNTIIPIESSVNGNADSLKVSPKQILAKPSSMVKINEAEVKTVELENFLTPTAIELAPKEIMLNLKPIEISSHIFSSQPTRRSIVANGMRLKEGDFIQPRVQVYEITHQGMIINVKNKLLIVDRSRGWGN